MFRFFVTTTLLAAATLMLISAPALSAGPAKTGGTTSGWRRAWRRRAAQRLLNQGGWDLLRHSIVCSSGANSVDISGVSVQVASVPTLLTRLRDQTATLAEQAPVKANRSSDREGDRKKEATLGADRSGHLVVNTTDTSPWMKLSRDGGAILGVGAVASDSIVVIGSLDTVNVRDKRVPIRRIEVAKKNNEPDRRDRKMPYLQEEGYSVVQQWNGSEWHHVDTFVSQRQDNGTANGVMVLTPDRTETPSTEFDQLPSHFAWMNPGT